MGKSHKSEKKSKKHKHKEHKEKKKSHKHKKKHSKSKEEEKGDKTKDSMPAAAVDDHEEDFAIPLDLMNSKSHAPETPEEYQKRQNRIRREVDPSTGRVRLIKGDGEVLEEIVTKERHKAINREATQGDGAFFQENTLGKLK
ncbi:ADP-ribosylation factor-like protein 6-interacting protein 4 [Musca vetustissima]|uniref:ADP-ribosylation factor-like protein 6-interacting protein 4 n=1 Tax=Musca vetustissima TaxID=27455 RepID=UPI002AB7C5DA|nr:ADP-ribosylation factor-like protein 6-interacting protein 4 [Musca vetustissima]